MGIETAISDLQKPNIAASLLITCLYSQNSFIHYQSIKGV
jgi:hypothetical protein